LLKRNDVYCVKMRLVQKHVRLVRDLTNFCVSFDLRILWVPPKQYWTTTRWVESVEQFVPFHNFARNAALGML
jgi:hypothetical protein